MSKQSAPDRQKGAQKLMNAILNKHETNGAFFMTETLTMKSINFLQACDILGDMHKTHHIDSGGFETHKGIHPTLGELILVANAADGTATLIQSSITAG